MVDRVSPEQSSLGRNMNLRGYLIVLTLPDKSVELIIESPKETKSRVDEIDKAIERTWDDLDAKYSADPTHDVILARTRNRGSLQKAFPDLRWDQANLKRLQI